MPYRCKNTIVVTVTDLLPFPPSIYHFRKSNRPHLQMGLLRLERKSRDMGRPHSQARAQPAHTASASFFGGQVIVLPTEIAQLSIRSCQPQVSAHGPHQTTHPRSAWSGIFGRHSHTHTQTQQYLQIQCPYSRGSAHGLTETQPCSSFIYKHYTPTHLYITHTYSISMD